MANGNNCASSFGIACLSGGAQESADCAPRNLRCQWRFDIWGAKVNVKSDRQECPSHLGRDNREETPITWMRTLALTQRWLPQPRVLHPYPAMLLRRQFS